jgi:hypothetical protein
MSYMSVGSKDDLASLFNLNFLAEAPLKRLIELSEQLSLGGSSNTAPRFPLRFGGWLQRNRAKISKTEEIHLKDVLALNIVVIESAQNVGQGTIRELFKFLHWLEHLVENNAVDSKGNPALASIGDSYFPSRQGMEHFLDSDKPLSDLIKIEGIDLVKIEDIWTGLDKVTLYGRQYKCEKPVPVRFFNLFRDQQKCKVIFDHEIKSFSDLLKLNRNQLKSIKGISVESEQMLFEHLLWLAESIRITSKESNLLETTNLILGELSKEERFVLERRSIFSGVVSFRAIQAEIKQKLGVSISGEMCRRKLISAQNKIQRIIDSPGSSKMLDLFGRIDAYLTDERSLSEVKSEIHFIATGKYSELDCLCEFCEKEGNFTIHIYGSLSNSVSCHNGNYFVDGYGNDELRFQLFSNCGVVGKNELAKFCIEKNIRIEEFLENLLKQNVFRIGEFVVDPKPMTNLFVAALKTENRPISIGDCIEKYGLQLNLRSFRNAVAGDERFVRVSKDEFAFADGEHEVYEGIAREMEKSIQNSGRTLLSSLQNDLKRRMKINPTSVLFFSTAPLFFVENGFISLRDESNRVREFPREVDGESRIVAPGEIELRFLCDKELLRGSGISIGAGTAALLGVQPGESKTYSFGENEIEVSWSIYSMSPRISSLRSIAIALNALRSNVLRIRFDVTSLSALGSVKLS